MSEEKELLNRAIACIMSRSMSTRTVAEETMLADYGAYTAKHRGSCMINREAKTLVVKTANKEARP